MTLLPYHHALYHLTEVDGIQWRQADWNSLCIVKAVKGEDFGGYVMLNDANGKAHRFDRTNADSLAKVVMRSLGAALADQIGGADISLVPIPNSGMAIGVQGPHRCIQLAEWVAEGYGDAAEVAPNLQWKKARQKAHKTKEFRHPDLYEPNLALVGVPSRPVVILDDVLTSGSQMIAAARVLEASGVPATRGVVLAKATKLQPDDGKLKWREGSLETRPDPFDIDW